MKSQPGLGKFGRVTTIQPDVPGVPDVPVIQHEHPDVTGGWLRPSVFGAMDGLVSNVALIAGVAGGTQHGGDSSAVLLAGIAGLVGGAFSMATGEYVSVASQSEAAAREIAKERREIIRNPVAETAELAEMYVEKGLEPRLAAEVARQIHVDVDNAVHVHAREELGVDPDDLASPRLAAASSFLSFAVGAFVPLLPYLLGSTQPAARGGAHAAGAVRLRGRGRAGHRPAVVVRRGPAGPAGRRRGRCDLRCWACSSGASSPAERAPDGP